MSYYKKRSYEFSYHAIQRCKERLNLKDKDDFEVREEVAKLLKMSTRSFETRHELYFSAANTNNYFVISKTSNLIITVTPISAEKMMTLMNEDY